MKPPFDIAADLDTPVSAYLKLAPFRPRFLLESVEGGERLARYSFIGFGDCLEVRLDASGLHVGDRAFAAAADSKAEFLNALRGALARAPQPMPEIPGVPLSGGLVGYTAYDAVRYFERLPGRSLDGTVDAACALRGAVLPAGIRSSDAQRRAAARRQRGRAAIPAARGHAGAAGRGAAIAALRAAASRPPRRRWPKLRTRRACGAPRNTSPRAMCISWCSRRASRDATRSRPSRSIGRCGC